MRPPFGVRLAFVVFIVAELALLVLVGQWLGGWAIFWLLLATGFVGGWAIQRAGVRTWTAMREGVLSGTAPELSGPGSMFTGGLLLIAPGFITDLVGLLLVVPQTRGVTRRMLGGLLPQLPVPRPRGQRPPGPPGQDGPVVEGEVIEGEVVEGEVIDQEPPDDGGNPPARA